MDQVWDTTTQEVHGGQTWRLCSNFHEDFSVTTNAFGAPQSALDASKVALQHIHHYPAADNGAALKAISDFTSFPPEQILLGNGASEFIDMIMRILPAGPFKPGPYKAAYMEYNRAAKAAGRDLLSSSDARDAAVTVIIHPNSPTGDCMSLSGIREVLESTSGAVVIDESFMPFMGPNWREESALSLVSQFPDRLLVIASWTKLWSCPGLRLGSISASREWTTRFKKLQTPWSCNTIAQAFCVAACEDAEYMKKSWETLPGWKKMQEEKVRQLGWLPNPASPNWVPWVFVECHDKEVAKRASEAAMKAGCPVRLCESFGAPTCIRLGVRDPQMQQILQEAWLEEFPTLS